MQKPSSSASLIITFFSNEKSNLTFSFLSHKSEDFEIWAFNLRIKKLLFLKSAYNSMLVINIKK